MIFPEHCKYVAVRDCDDLISRPFPGEPVYFSSRYLISFWQGQAAIYEVYSNGEGVVRSISVVNKIADFCETSIYEHKIDIFNRSKLIKQAKRLCKPPIKAVVFQGFDLHWTFVYGPDLTNVIEIEIFDITPPDPPYIVTLIKKLEEAGIFGDLSVSFKPVVYDLRRLKIGTIFPCSASGMGSSYLNKPGVRIHEDSVLVGCDMSREVLEARFPGVHFVQENICPTKTIRPHKPFVAKCCRSARVGPIELNGILGCVVHWGANPYEVVSAIRALISRYNEDSKVK
ncbi:MAG: DUF7714 family protein [Halobacteriota archaeon]